MGMDPLLGYTGEWLDRATGGYALGNGYRWYLPSLMRFAAPADRAFFSSPTASFEGCPKGPAPSDTERTTCHRPRPQA